MTPLHAVVIGAGVGGLAAAIGLRRAGLQVTIIEQAPALGEVGAGIQISPNASRILARYGLKDAMDRVGVLPSAIVYRRWQDGAELSRRPLGADVFGRYGAPYYHFHRADLIDILTGGLNDVRLELGRKFIALSQDEQGVVARFADGGEVRGDLLIGADGIHSGVRQALFGEERPRFSGNVAYRGLVPAKRLAHLGLQHEVTNWVGPGGHFVHYFVSGGQFLNFVAVTEETEWTREGWSEKGSLTEAIESYAGWSPQLAEILGAADETFKWALCDRDPAPVWTADKVALLGDACHPMLPYLAQGAAQSIEDGAMLAACLKGATAGDIASALERYARHRQPRTAWVQRSARRNAITFHLPDGPGQVARDRSYQAANSSQAHDVTDRLYGHDAEDISEDQPASERKAP